MSLSNGSNSNGKVVPDQPPPPLALQQQAPPPQQQQQRTMTSPTHGVGGGARNGGGGPGVHGKREKTAGSGMSPCAACKLLRRRCAKECVFAPYFPPDEPQKFANVHKVFGASNVNKMLQDLPLHQRSDAVGSMVYEADSRVRDPVYGCVGLVSALQQQVASLQQQLASAQAEIVCLRMHHAAVASNVVSMKGMHQPPPQQQGMGPGGSAAAVAATSIAASMSAPPPHGHGGHGHHHSSPLHGHHSPHHHSGHHHSHMSPHHSPPTAGPNGMHPQSPELPHQCKPGSGMLMGMDTMDVGQAMWA